jgi:hypothetical protein
MWNKIISLAVLLALVGCGKTSVQSTRTLQAPAIDGYLTDWKAIFPLKLDKHTQLYVSNDDSSLYFAANLSKQGKMMFPANLTLWLDPKVEKNKDWTVYFPAATHAEFDKYRGGFWNSLTAEQKTEVSARLDSLRQGVLVVNEKAGFRRLYLPCENEEFALVIKTSDDSLTVEAKIPFTFDSNFQNSIATQTPHSLGIGFIINAAPKIAIGTQPPGMPPRFASRKAPPDSALAPKKEPINEPKEVWLEVILADEK